MLFRRLFVLFALVISLVTTAVSAEPTAEELRDFNELKTKAMAGDANAQYKLAGIYGKGGIVPKDDSEAVKWFRKAAEQNDPRGQSMLGVMYTNARGVNRDYTEAMKWFQKAADQNSAHAQYNLGHMYSTGKGVTKDDKESANWYRKAAEQNDTNSQRILGSLYAQGRGVAKDLVHAHAWTAVAGAKGNEVATKELLKLEEQMSAEHKADAKKLATEITERLAKRSQK